MGVSKTSDHIQNKIKMPDTSQEAPASSKALNHDVKDMDNKIEPKCKPLVYQRALTIFK